VAATQHIPAPLEQQQTPSEVPPYEGLHCGRLLENLVVVQRVEKFLTLYVTGRLTAFLTLRSYPCID
jgi:hypothetical protein